jgi:two-component system sensor histidine kinase DesK
MEVGPRAAGVVLGSLLLLGLVLTLAIGQEGTSTAVYVAVISVLCLRRAWAVSFIVLLVASLEVSATYVPGWDHAGGLVFAVCASAFAMWGVQQLMYRNVDLLRAREENARLAVAEERSRFARDLHDILGHSLTVITVKAELAGRLLDVDPARARRELADVERLGREALADVRQAVEGYREVTLPGELARARAALAAADIAADLPTSADEPRGEARELFAWAVREGVTNVVRHSRARTCRISLDATSVEVVDDGVGPCEAAGGSGVGSDLPGNGLRGLRERAAALDAVVVTRALDPGFALEVRVR